MKLLNTLLLLCAVGAFQVDAAEPAKKLGTTQASKPPVKDPVVMIVEGRKIKLSQILPQLMTLTGGNFQNFSNEQMVNLLYIAKKMFIMQELLVKEATKKGYQNNPNHKLAFQKAVENASVNIYMGEISKSFSDSQLRAAYEKYVKRLNLQDISFRLIIVKDANTAKLITESLSSGVDFAKLAKEKSEHASADRDGAASGLIDFVREDRLAQGFGQQFVGQIKGLSVGAVKTVQLADGRYAIVKMANKRKAAAPLMKEVEQNLRMQLTNEFFLKMTDSFLTSGKVKFFSVDGKEESVTPPKANAAPAKA